MSVINYDWGLVCRGGHEGTSLLFLSRRFPFEEEFRAVFRQSLPDLPKGSPITFLLGPDQLEQAVTFLKEVDPNLPFPGVLGVKVRWVMII